MPFDGLSYGRRKSGKTCIDHLRKQGDKLFGDREPLMNLLQEIAENFYVERADFTTTHYLGRDMAANLTSSYPLLIRRDLGNAFGAMLRPSAKDWFEVGTARKDREDTLAKQWLEWAGNLQRRAMYDSVTGFVRATKEADHDFAAFGMACIQHNLFRPLDGSTPHLLFKNHHLRDMAWQEDVTGRIGVIYRKWKPTVWQLSQLRNLELHKEVTKKRGEKPFDTVNCWHIVMRGDLYSSLPGASETRHPWVSIYLDVDNDHEMECVPKWTRGYTIPRWQTVSGSQYAFSPATVAALPDARLLQAFALVLLEAGEKSVNPPTISVADAVRSDLAMYAGGNTWVDADYDERMGEVIRPLTTDIKGLNFGMEMLRDLRSTLSDAFFLSKLNMPPVGGPDMTAYEVGQRVQEYIRNALPLFEPMEMDYNAAMCEDVFLELLRASPEMMQSMPRSIQGTQIQFRFESPLREASEKAKAGQLIEAGQIIAQASQMDATAAVNIDMRKAVRDTLPAVMPAAWLRTEDEVTRIVQEQQAKADQERMLAMVSGAAKVAKTSSEAAANLSGSLPGLGVS